MKKAKQKIYQSIKHSSHQARYLKVGRQEYQALFPSIYILCCSSIFTLEQFVFELVQNSLNWYNFNCTGEKTVKIV